MPVFELCIAILATKCWEVVVRVWHPAAYMLQMATSPLHWVFAFGELDSPREKPFLFLCWGRREVCSTQRYNSLQYTVVSASLFSIAIKGSLPDGVRLHIYIFHFLCFEANANKSNVEQSNPGGYWWLIMLWIVNCKRGDKNGDKGGFGFLCDLVFPLCGGS